MKRRSLRMSSSVSSCCSDDGDDLGSSLKRVRISTSPGELRLDRDLQQLGWTMQNRMLTPQIRLDRVQSLQLILTFSPGNFKIHVDIPRLYPHGSPKIVHAASTSSSTLSNSSYTNSNSRSNASTTSTQHWEQFDEWTPIMTLQDFISYCWRRWHAMSAANASANGGHAMISDDTALDQMTVDSIEQPGKHESIFAPDRFNVGYDRDVPTRGMEC